MDLHQRQVILVVSSRYQTGFGGRDNLRTNKKICNTNQFYLIFILFSTGCPWKKDFRWSYATECLYAPHW